MRLLDTAELPVMQEPTAKPIHSKEGDSALMTCVVRNLGDYTVLWKTENKDRHSWKVLTAAESRITADRRFEVLHDKGKYRKNILIYGYITILDKHTGACM